MTGEDPAPTPVGNIKLNGQTFNWQAKDKSFKWRCFHSELENILLDPYAAMKEKQKAALVITWLGHDGSELVDSTEMITRDTTQESLKNLCDTVEQILNLNYLHPYQGSCLENSN